MKSGTHSPSLNFRLFGVFSSFLTYFTGRHAGVPFLFAMNAKQYYM